MAQVKFLGGEPRIVPAIGGLVQPGQVVDVADEAVWGLTQQVIWEPADGPAKAATKQGAVDRDARVADEQRRRTVNVVPAPAERAPGKPEGSE